MDYLSSNLPVEISSEFSKEQLRVVRSQHLIPRSIRQE